MFYMIYLERKDRCRLYRNFKFERQVANIYEALEEAEKKIEKLKLQIGIDYEVVMIEKI